MRPTQRTRQPGGCLGCLDLSLIVLVVGGVLAVEQWFFQSHVGPYPATLRSGEQEQKGRIGVVCWPGVNDGSDDNDPCPGWCELPGQDWCVPDELLVVASHAPVVLDFSKTGIPAELTYRFYTPSDLSMPLLVKQVGRSGADRVLLPAVDLPPDEYLLHVQAAYGFGPEHSASSGSSEQGFRISISGD